MILQVEDAEKALKMKICPRNVFLSCYKLNFLAAMPREELHQFLIGLYGEYIIPSAFHSIKSVLRKPEFILSTNAKGVHKYLVTNEMLENVWVRLRDRLSSLDSSTSLLQVTSEYAAHFYDMYVEGHTGKHLTGRSYPDIASEPSFCVSRPDSPRGEVSLNPMISLMISYMISLMISYVTVTCE